MDFDFYYAIFCIFIILCAGFLFYQAALGNKFAIFIVCVNLATAYGDHVYSQRHDSLIAGFYKGITKDGR